MAQNHEGGCSCGAVRYRVMSDPVGATVCHCGYCQRRTGSAFGIGVFFHDSDVEVLRGDPNWLALKRHVWIRSAQKWVPIPHGVERFEQGSLPAPK